MNMMPSSDLQPFRLRIEDYELLDRAGAFEDQKVELVEGAIITVNAQFQADTVVQARLAFRLQVALEAMTSPLMALSEASLALPPHNLPNPDILIARAVADRSYFRVEQVAIVIEVSDSTLRRDLGGKRTLYAVNSIPEYWVVDVDGRQVHQFWTPADGSYADSRIVPLAGALQSATLADLTIDGHGIL